MSTTVPPPERDEKTKVPTPHRCNARLEDFIQSLFTLEFRHAIIPAWKNFSMCLASEPGNEPQDAYLVIEDAQKYLDGSRMKKR